MKVLARDDCWTYYAKKIIESSGVKVDLLCHEEKTPAAILVDRMLGRVADAVLVRSMLRSEYCFGFQRRAQSLVTTGAEVVIVGSFADLTIKPYQHNVEGWKFFEMAKYFSTEGKARLSLEFTRLPHSPESEVVSDNIRIFNIYTQNNPDAVKVWVNYPYIRGANLRWDHGGAVTEVENRILESRHRELKMLSELALPLADVHVYSPPNELVTDRGDGQLWHYHDSVYEHFAFWLLDLVGNA